MNEFSYKNGVYHAESVPIPEIAAQAGTPSYIYSRAAITSQFERLKDAMAKALPADRQPLLCYACKANTHGAILKILKDLGAGLEIVSEGELLRGLKAGFEGHQIVSTSFGKTPREIEACLKANILQLNIEAAEELPVVNDVAGKLGKVCDVVFRLNPNVVGGGHAKISTGKKRDKFGTGAERIIDLYRQAEEMDHINPVGLSVHIGSQVSNVAAFKPSFEILAGMVQTLRGQGFKVDRLDIGGGFPIQYNNEDLLDLDAYAKWVGDIVVPLDTEIQMEPGRYLIGNAGILLSEVIYEKQAADKTFLVIDAAMNDLIRPTLYEAYHGIVPILDQGRPTKTYDIVGPICESGDFFAQGREIAESHAGELVALQSAGAYGFCMTSNYNSRPMSAEVLVDGDRFEIIRPRQTIEDFIGNEKIPSWL